MRALRYYKTGVGAGQIVFLRPKIRSLFVERNAFFSELDFHAILPCVIFVVFYVILNSPGLQRHRSGGGSEAHRTTRTLGLSLYREQKRHVLGVFRGGLAVCDVTGTFYN